MPVYLPPLESCADEDDKSFVGALKYRATWLNGWYDIIVSISRLGKSFKREVLCAIELSGNERIVDIGCGTGVLMREAGGYHAELEMVGIDPDPEMLRMAARKVSQLKNKIDLIRGFSTQIALPDQSVDVCFSTLTFHHLSRVQKQKTAAEAQRILKDGGKLVVADFRRIRFPFLAWFFLFENRKYLRENFEGLVYEVLSHGGFSEIREIRRPFSLVSIIVAKKS